MQRPSDLDLKGAPPGRKEGIPPPARHFVLGSPIAKEHHGTASALFAMGCFWGAEKKFWQAEGVFSTAVGYAGGYTPNPLYEEVCSELTGHAEVVLVAFNSGLTSYEAMLKIFWEHHDPTQGMRQGADVGTQYRSGIYTFNEEQQKLAEASRDVYQRELTDSGYRAITTEIRPASSFYFAEEYHQQYLAKNPAGYCGGGGTGVACPSGI